jgi:hypothetical protein
MKKNDVNYPYPILTSNNHDYVNCSFHAKLLNDLLIVNNEILIKLEYILNCNGIKEIIKDCKAKVMAQIKCSATSYRKIFSFEQNILEIKINKDDLVGKVIIHVYVVAIEDIDGFFMPEHNKDFFQNLSFKVFRGDKLALGDVISFNIDFYDPLRPIASVFSIRRSQNDKESLSLDYFSENKIVLFLNDELFDKYIRLRVNPEITVYLSSLIITPALVEILSFLKRENEEEVVGRRWHTSMLRTLQKLNIDISSTNLSLYTIANKILKNGLLSSFNCIESFYNSEIRGE